MPNDGDTFTEYMINQTAGLSGFECYMNEDCGEPTSEYDGCPQGPDEKNPMKWFYFYAARNYQIWNTQILQAIEYADVDFATNVNLLTVDFVSHDYTASASTWKNSVISGTLSALSAIITLATTFLAGALGAAIDVFRLIGGLASLGSGASTIGNGILHDIIHATVEIVADELSEAETAAMYVSNTTTALKKAVIAMGNDAMNSPAYNPPVVSEFYFQNKTGILTMLADGAFAETPPSDSVFNISAKTLQAIYSIAISNLWNQQGVYLVNCSDIADPSGGFYSAMNINKNDLTRTIIGKDTIIALKHTDGKAPNEAYDPVPGADKLSIVGLNMTGMILASAWSQRKAGYNATWSASDGLAALTSDDPPPYGLFATLPICTLVNKAVPGASSWHGTNLCDDEVGLPRIRSSV
ncbi:uncharacterized protein N7459_007636 [Penicillium hispanicum]|uniref:uncharacterized protein n=1 Tax=Penicillium hispanicum TaxID=1080232 RepID=UPI00254216A3|nr:uncharacterized protein N7459_007636 [Penicillium hispanicum]KAJ5578672.1 hypothetical protein N7459_007636 [Penicillium hispanicum]